MNTLRPFPSPRLFDFDRLANNLLRGLDQVPSPVSRESRPSPALDLFENDEHFLVRLELPGVSRDQLELNFEDKRLQLSWPARSAKGSSSENTDSEPSPEPAPNHSLSLRTPADIDPSRISARLEHGLLEIELPKAEESRTRRIEIK